MSRCLDLSTLEPGARSLGRCSPTFAPDPLFSFSTLYSLVRSCDPFPFSFRRSPCAVPVSSHLLHSRHHIVRGAGMRWGETGEEPSLCCFVVSTPRSLVLHSSSCSSVSRFPFCGCAIPNLATLRVFLRSQCTFPVPCSPSNIHLHVVDVDQVPCFHSASSFRFVSSLFVFDVPFLHLFAFARPFVWPGFGFLRSRRWLLSPFICAPFAPFPDVRLLTWC